MPNCDTEMNFVKSEDPSSNLSISFVYQFEKAIYRGGFLALHISDMPLLFCFYTPFILPLLPTIIISGFLWVLLERLQDIASSSTP